MTSWRAPSIRRSERGVALVVVVFILIIVLAGGLAAVALTSGELSSTYGYRTRMVAEECAQAAIEKIRAKLPELTVGEIEDTAFPLPSGGTVTIRAGHIDGLHGLAAGDSPIYELDPSSYDSAALLSGENITNSMGTAGAGLRLMTVVATCEAGGSRQEIQLVLRYGAATAP